MAKSIATRLLNAGASKSGISKVWILILLSFFFAYFVFSLFSFFLFPSCFLSFSLFSIFFIHYFLLSLLYSHSLFFFFFLIDYCPFLFLPLHHIWHRPKMTVTSTISTICWVLIKKNSEALSKLMWVFQLYFIYLFKKNAQMYVLCVSAFPSFFFQITDISTDSMHTPSKECKAAEVEVVDDVEEETPGKVTRIVKRGDSFGIRLAVSFWCPILLHFIDRISAYIMHE